MDPRAAGSDERSPDDGPSRAAAGRVSGVARRFGWGLADQVFSSLTNFALTFLVARSVDVSGFGAFALAFAAYLTALGLSRAAVTSPLSIRYSTRREEWSGAAGAAAGAAVVLGVALGIVCALVGWLIGGGLRLPLVVLGCTLPALLLQDSWRFAFFAQAKGHRAFINDVVWAVTLLPVIVLVSASDSDDPSAFIAAWGGTAGLAGLIGAFQARVAPNPALGFAWWRQHRELSDWFVGEFVAIRGSVHVASLCVAAFLGLEAIAALRAGTVLMGPVHTVLMGLVLVAVPEGARMLASSPTRLKRTMLFVSGAVTAVAVAWGVVLMTLPDAVGSELLGQTWGPTESILLPLTFTVALAGAAVGLRSGLRALGAGRETFRARLYVTTLGLIGVFAGALIGRSAVGVAWGDAISNGLSLIVWWRAFHTALVQHGSARASAGAHDRIE
jgi:O-antigen/teichoic acid export membrane protein